jgi:phosphoribosylglycinamide formyltransferase-1
MNMAKKGAEKHVKTRVAVLISGRGSNMTALIEAAKDESFPAEIDHTAFGKDREAFERAVDAQLAAHRIELVCLAGFMRLLTPWLVRRWEGRLINIHPALLPAYKGLNTHERVLAAGEKTHGATVHFVVPQMDSGPIIAQGRVPVHDDDTPETLAARVLAEEHRLYPLALARVACGRVRMAGGQCHSDDIARDARGDLTPRTIEPPHVLCTMAGTRDRRRP